MSYAQQLIYQVGILLVYIDNVDKLVRYKYLQLIGLKKVYNMDVWRDSLTLK